MGATNFFNAKRIPSFYSLVSQHFCTEETNRDSYVTLKCMFGAFLGGLNVRRAKHVCYLSARKRLFKNYFCLQSRAKVYDKPDVCVVCVLCCVCVCVVRVRVCPPRAINRKP